MRPRMKYGPVTGTARGVSEILRHLNLGGTPHFHVSAIKYIVKYDERGCKYNNYWVRAINPSSLTKML